MTQDIASLGIKIDTSDVAKAERDLDGLNQAGQKTEQAAQKVGSAWEKAAGKISGDTGEIVKQLQALNKTQSATIQALAGLDKTVSKFGTNFGQAAAKIHDVSGASAALAKTEKESAKAFEVGTQSLDQQKQALARLLGQIDPVVAAMARLDAQQDELQKNRNLGLIDAATFDQYRTKIDAARASLNNVDASLRRTGVSSAQTAAALRQLPAQFSDIVISLQAGQSPFSVFLQQGAQIKDSFGGVGAALRETGKFALGLVNPLTLAAAAAAALAFAYKQGSDEATAYNKAIVLTGNYAGTSADQLETLARQLDDVGGTQRQNARALAEIVGTGRFASRQLESLTAAAVAMENATGKAVSETVAEYVKLADAPVTAILELNKSQRFLTAEIYSQIVALEEAGRTTEAADLALKSYSDTMQSRASQVVDNLGAIEGAWEKVKKGAAEAWDEVLAVGREQTIDERLAELRKRVAEIQSGGQGGRGRFGLGIAGSGDASAELNQIAELEGRKQQDSFITGFLEDVAKANAASVKAVENINNVGRAIETNAQKRQRELDNLAKSIEALKKTDPTNPLASAENQAKLRAGIIDRYKDPKAARAPQVRDDAATRMLMTLREQQATLQEQLGTETKLTEAQRARARFESLIADLKEKKILTADQKSLQANQEALRLQHDKNVALSEEIRLRDESNKLAAFQANLQSQTQSAADAYQMQLASVGLGRQQAGQLQERLRLEQQAAQQQNQIQEQFNRGDISKDLYKSETQALSDSLSERLQMQQDYFDKLEQAQGDWTNGAKAAFADYSEEARNTASQTYDIVKGSLDTLTDGFGKAVADAAIHGKDFEDSMKSVGLAITENVISGLAQMAARMLINAAIGQTIAATTTQANALLALETATVWAPAAAAVSLASFGANSAPAEAGIASTYALTQTLAATGFKDGGFTGNIPKDKIAGVVHGKEFVFDAAATSRIGVENLEKLRSGREIAKTSSTMANNGAQERQQLAALGARIDRLNVRPIQNFNVTTPNADSFRLSERQITKRARQRIS